MTTVESSWNVWRRSSPAVGGALGFLAALFSASCGSVPKTSYYTLQVPAALAPGNPQTNYILGAEELRAPEVLRDDRIAYYVSPNQMNFYEYHRWGADPAPMHSEFAPQRLEASGASAHVRVLPIRERVDYTLEGRVLSLEEVD